jgi:hypothetical protein
MTKNSSSSSWCPVVGLSPLPVVAGASRRQQCGREIGVFTRQHHGGSSGE